MEAQWIQRRSRNSKKQKKGGRKERGKMGEESKGRKRNKKSSLIPKGQKLIKKDSIRVKTRVDLGFGGMNLGWGRKE